MPDERDPKRRALNRRWLELIDAGYEIDLGSRWRALVLRAKFVDTVKRKTDLRYGATDRLGYELLERPLRRVVLRAGVGVKANMLKAKGAPRHRIAVVEEAQRLSYEPVPIETVLWDGQGSSTSSQANYQRVLRQRDPDEVLPFRGESPLLGRKRPAKRKPARGGAKQGGGVKKR